MARSVTFDVNQLIGALDVIQGTQIRYAGTQAMKRLGYELREESKQLMARTFNNPVPFTLSSPRYAADGLSVRMSIYDGPAPKGQDPAKYLYPVSTEDTQGSKPAYPTRFIKALQARGIVGSNYYAVPWLRGRGVPVNAYGNVPPAFYAATLAGLARQGAPGAPRTRQAGWQYISVPDQRIGPAVRRTSSLERRPGIYRVKGRELEFLFGLQTKQPTVPTKFDWRGHLTRRAEPLLSRLLSQELDKALR